MKHVKGGLLFFSIALFFIGCENQAIRDNREFIRRQEEEIAQLRAENDRRREETEGRRREQEEYEACRRAFVSFEQAQVASNAREAESFYREGLALCPRDDVAHYELGRILAEGGRPREAQEEFEAALKVNPDFAAARDELERLRMQR
ncbi:MAG TPA: tetratricopeptide repeat protein [Verrucomicrobiae bacterium]|jgi:tetratricopeptide (TPR) repeat protein|nr:tetratricopeptide repeat protein [Verrucomicrobiae bacterium]